MSILVIHHGTLGDIVAAFPTLISIREKYGGVDMICRDSIGKLAKHLGIVDRYFSMDAAIFAFFYGEAPVLHGQRILSSYERVLLFSFSESIETRISEVLGKSVFRISPRPGPEIRESVPLFLFRKVKKVLHVTENIPPAPGGIQQNEEDKRAGKIILMHPGSGSIKKNWPMEYFFQLADLLENKGWRPVFLLGPVEKDSLRTSERTFPVDVYEPTDLVDLANILSTGSAYVGNDSGPSHLAAFLGLRCTVIFGPSDPVRWKPFGRFVCVVSPEAPCEPCFETGKKTDCIDNCFSEITPEKVFSVFMDCQAMS